VVHTILVVSQPRSTFTSTTEDSLYATCLLSVQYDGVRAGLRLTVIFTPKSSLANPLSPAPSAESKMCFLCSGDPVEGEKRQINENTFSVSMMQAPGADPLCAC
jgi:hypothetical protein